MSRAAPAVEFPATVPRVMDTTYALLHRNLITSGKLKKIGASAFTVLSVIKQLADFNSGKCDISHRSLSDKSGLSRSTISSSLTLLESEGLIRKFRQGFSFKGQPKKYGDIRGVSNIYIAVEQFELTIGGALICTVSIDYVPTLIQQHAQLIAGVLKNDDADAAKNALEKINKSGASISIRPAPGFVWNDGRMQGQIISSE